MSRKKTVKIAQTVNELLGLSPEVYTERLTLTISSNRCALVSHYDRVCEYTCTCAAFLADNILCEIRGENLQLYGIAQDAAKVSGTIISVTYTEADR